MRHLSQSSNPEVADILSDTEYTDVMEWAADQAETYYAECEAMEHREAEQHIVEQARKEAEAARERCENSRHAVIHALTGEVLLTNIPSGLDAAILAFQANLTNPEEPWVAQELPRCPHCGAHGIGYGGVTHGSCERCKEHAD